MVGDHQLAKKSVTFAASSLPALLKWGAGSSLGLFSLLSPGDFIIVIFWLTNSSDAFTDLGRAGLQPANGFRSQWVTVR